MILRDQCIFPLCEACVWRDFPVRQTIRIRTDCSWTDSFCRRCTSHSHAHKWKHSYVNSMFSILCHICICHSHLHYAQVDLASNYLGKYTYYSNILFSLFTDNHELVDFRDFNNLYVYVFGQTTFINTNFWGQLNDLSVLGTRNWNTPSLRQTYGVPRCSSYSLFPRMQTCVSALCIFIYM